jgi:CxxC motif-containing protein (DUF1111 family)
VSRGPLFCCVCRRPVFGGGKTAPRRAHPRCRITPAGADLLLLVYETGLVTIARMAADFGETWDTMSLWLDMARTRRGERTMRRRSFA